MIQEDRVTSKCVTLSHNNSSWLDGSEVMSGSHVLEIYLVGKEGVSFSSRFFNQLSLETADYPKKIKLTNVEKYDNDNSEYPKLVHAHAENSCDSDGKSERSISEQKNNDNKNDPVKSIDGPHASPKVQAIEA
mmetsp:Transcript_13408/g.14859  ORF Transcript_13408/g.14859 Transcript_13408/m.14859 type:complete len:133 (-) Transcript_13408:64-462(-)